MFHTVSYQEFDKKVFIILSGSAMINATLALVMISLPFLLLSMNLSFSLMGVVEAVGLLTNFAARVPAKMYAETNGSESGISAGLIAMGVSMSFLFLSRNISLIIAAVFLINVSYTLFYYGIRPKLSWRVRDSNADKVPSTYSLFNASGPFAALILAGLYRGADMRPLYGGISLILLLAGVLSLFFLIFNKPQKPPVPLSARFRELVKKPLLALNDLSMIGEKDFLVAYSILQIVTAMSIGSVLVFMPAMAIEDGLGRSEIFFLFASVGVASFGLKYAGRLLVNDLLGRVFFLLRPVVMLFTLIVLSLGYHQELFIAGFSVTALWSFLDPGSQRFAISRFEGADPERIAYLLSLFSRPVAVIAPLMGALLWLSSPRLLFAVALIPAVIALLLANIMVNRPETLKFFRQRRTD